MTAVLTRLPDAAETKERTPVPLAAVLPTPAPVAVVLQRKPVPNPRTEIADVWGMDSFPASDPPSNW